MARCPNCARPVRFWHNHSGYCSKQCRAESVTSCPNCGKVGLYKHARLGCCSEECCFWYVATLLGYDKEALVTPAPDKVVYHVRLPSGSAEIASLQLDELEYDRASDTVLVVAAPPWMTRSKVLAELPYDRFDNVAWQHLWADGTLTEDELFRFHRVCYDDDLLCQKLGELVFARLRQPAPVYSPYVPPPGLGGEPISAISGPLLPPTQPVVVPQARIAPPAVAPDNFARAVRAIFEDRGFAVSNGPSDDTLLLRRNNRISLAAFRYQTGLVDTDVVERAFARGAAAGASTVYVVTNYRFTLQAEDLAVAHSMQLIDGEEMAQLAARRREMPTVAVAGDPLASPNGTAVENGHGTHGDAPAHHVDMAVLERGDETTMQLPLLRRSEPVDAEIVAGEDAARP